MGPEKSTVGDHGSLGNSNLGYFGGPGTLPKSIEGHREFTLVDWGVYQERSNLGDCRAREL